MVEPKETGETESKRRVEVEASFFVIAEGGSPFDARLNVMKRVSNAIDEIDGVESGSVLGTSGGKEVGDD